MKFLCNIELTRKSGGSEPVRNIINNIGNSFYAASDTLYVSPGYSNYPGPYYDTISDAITAASSGDTIIVYPGSYDERLSVTKSLNFYFYPGAVLAPTDDTGTTLFDINYGGSSSITVNIDGFLTINYSVGSYVPKRLRIGKAYVYARLRAIEGAAGTNGEAIVVDSMTARAWIDIETIEDGTVNIDDAIEAHINAKRIDNLKLNNCVSYININKIAGTVDIDGGTNYINGGHFVDHIDIDGGTTIIRDANIEADYRGHLIDIDNSAATVRLYNCRIKNSNSTITNSCVNLSALSPAVPVIMRDCVLIKDSGTYTIEGFGDVYTYGTIASHNEGTTITANGDTMQVDTLIVSEF